jgi:hypothetical protein
VSANQSTVTFKPVPGFPAYRAAGIGYSELSRKCRVHKSTVCRVVTRRVWRHV